MKKIIIIGCDSMVGKAIGFVLSSQHKVLYAGRGASADIQIDLKNLHIDHKENCDVIIHCAASFKGDASIEEIRENEIVNSVGALTIAQLALQTNCKHLINISSLFAVNPTTSYGLSKKHADENLEFFCNLNGIKYTSLLPSQIYDEKGHAQKHQSFFYHLIQQAAFDKEIILYGKEDPLRNFIFLNDMVKIIERVCHSSLEGRFLCLHPCSYPLSQIVKIIIKTLNSKSSFKRDESRISPSPYKIPEDFSLYKTIGYFPETSLEMGVKQIEKNWLRDV